MAVVAPSDKEKPMVKKSIFTFQDSWPWMLIVALIVTATTNAISYAQAHGFDQQGFLVLGITVAVFMALITTRYVMRAVFIKNWNEAFQTRLGAAVLPNDVVDVPFRDIDQVCDDAAFFWKDWAVKNLNLTANSAQVLIANAFSGATIICSSKVIEVGNQWFNGKFLGIQEGQNIYVVYDKEVVADKTTFLGLVKHEVSHLCLTALGVAPGFMGNNQHEIFAQTGYC
jgi:hypothetical protein